ncbi:MAG: TetR/AcrR family transcriptional regulator [Bacteroidales bacterium]
MEPDKRQIIIDKAFEMFRSYGVRSTAIEDICRNLGISKKTFYKYFSNKTDLLKHVSWHIHLTISRKFEELEKKDLNAIDYLLEISKIASDTHVKMNSIVAWEMRKYYPMVFEDYHKQKKEIIVDGIRKNLEQGIKEGLYREDLDLDIIANLYYQRIEDFRELNPEELKTYSHEKIFQVMFENHIRAIANEKGLKYFEEQKAKINFQI